MAYELVCNSDFHVGADAYQAGDKIVDPALVASILDSHNALHVSKVWVADPPPPAPARPVYVPPIVPPSA